MRLVPSYEFLSVIRSLLALVPQDLDAIAPDDGDDVGLVARLTSTEEDSAATET